MFLKQKCPLVYSARADAHKMCVASAHFFQDDPPISDFIMKILLLKKDFFFLLTAVVTDIPQPEVTLNLFYLRTLQCTFESSQHSHFGLLNDMELGIKERKGVYS